MPYLLRHVVGVLLVVCTLTACTTGTQKGDTVNEDAEALLKQRVDRTRDAVDGLVQKLEGEGVEVLQEVVTDCIPGREDLGRSLVYSLRMTVPPGTLDRLRGEIADEYEAQGFTVRRDPSGDSVRFLTKDFSMGATMAPEGGEARVVSGSGCVQDARGDAGVRPKGL